MNRFSYLVFGLFFISAAGCATIDSAKQEEKYKLGASERFSAAGIGSLAEKPALSTAPAGIKEKPKRVVSKAAAASPPAPAPEKEIEPEKKPAKKRGKIGMLVIKSNTMDFKKTTSMSVFRGNVRLTADNVELYCDRLSSENYRDNAVAEGNVRVFYREHGINMRCGRVVYGSGMGSIDAYEKVTAVKTLDDGNTLTMRADKISFNTGTGEIRAVKEKNKVRVEFKDVLAFSDEVVYNENNDMLTLTGNPAVRKTGSFFMSRKVSLDVNTKTISLEGDIKSQLYYSDFEKAAEEAKIEKDSDKAPR
ncbi:MAG TPA: hypothetical protein ENN43_08360 [bacterium]|nr:hypothetical protein [bacterium]